MKQVWDGLSGALSVEANRSSRLSSVNLVAAHVLNLVAVRLETGRTGADND